MLLGCNNGSIYYIGKAGMLTLYPLNIGVMSLMDFFVPYKNDSNEFDLNFCCLLVLQVWMYLFYRYAEISIKNEG